MINNCKKYAILEYFLMLKNLCFAKINLEETKITLLEQD